jgi:hypothetical protein
MFGNKLSNNVFIRRLAGRCTAEHIRLRGQFQLLFLAALRIVKREPDYRKSGDLREASAGLGRMRTVQIRGAVCAVLILDGGILGSVRESDSGGKRIVSAGKGLHCAPLYPYVFLTGKYEISEQMIEKANALGGLGITKDTRGPDMPATSVTWYEAAKFVNWLNTSTGGLPAYKFDGSGNFQLWRPTDQGYESTNLYRNKLARYVLPSVHEWHKAAFYNPNSGTYYTYTTASDTVPDGIDFPGDAIFDAVFYDGGLNSNPDVISNVGVASPYGTLGQGGNVDEWVETASDFVNNATSEQRMRIGGSWVDGVSFLSSYGSSSAGPSVERQYSGFRIVSTVPEPPAIALSIAGVCVLLSFSSGHRQLLRNAAA